MTTDREAEVLVQGRRKAWCQFARGEGPADQFLIRGTRHHQTVVLKDRLAQGAGAVSDSTQAHTVAMDARAPLHDGGSCTRVDAVSLGVMAGRPLHHRRPGHGPLHATGVHGSGRGHDHRHRVRTYRGRVCRDGPEQRPDLLLIS